MEQIIKNKTIAKSLIEKINNGMNAVEAIKDLIGEVEYDKFITDLYNELRSKTN